MERKLERDLKVVWPGGSGATSLCSCPAQTRLVTEQSQHGCETVQHNAELQGGSSSISSLAGVPGTDTHPEQHSLLHPRGCSSSGSEGLEGWGSCSLGTWSLRSGLGHSARAAPRMCLQLSVQSINRGLKSLGLLICHLSSALN